MKKALYFILLSIMTISITNCGDKSANKDKNHKPEETYLDSLSLSQDVATGFSKLALTCIQKEYPNKLSHVMNDESEVLGPRALHPSFYGCFDWHSSVHGHWMLVRLLKQFPEMSNANEIRTALDNNLTAENVKLEVDYLHQPSRQSFERTYGWAWLLKLADELYTWNDPDAAKWSKNLQPLADAIVKSYMDFLPKQIYPIRTGVHPNTAFGLSFALDYARTIKNVEFENLLLERSKTYYFSDQDCPSTWEPGGEDFLSPCLAEADLMRRVIPTDQYGDWLNKFLPGLQNDEPKTLLTPAIVADRNDPKIVHLDGLNLSRAWCMIGIANSLSPESKVRTVLLKSAKLHADDALKHVASGNYEGEHWLASFAVYMLSVDK